MLLFLSFAYNLIYVPFAIAFGGNIESAFCLFDLLVLSICVIDIVLNYCTDFWSNVILFVA